MNKKKGERGVDCKMAGCHDSLFDSHNKNALAMALSTVDTAAGASAMLSSMGIKVLGCWRMYALPRTTLHRGEEGDFLKAHGGVAHQYQRQRKNGQWSA